MNQPRIGRVDLTVSDMSLSTRFYEAVIGLQVLTAEAGSVLLGAGNRELLRLVELPGARPAPGTTGLYHFALLLPSRRDLALALFHFQQIQAPISGYADHAVSEAIYLTDPDGHGIEVYRDRPRAEWQYPDGVLKMSVDPLDIRGIMVELPTTNPTWDGLPQDTVMGHIHLQVSDILATEQFYIDMLGFDRILRYGPSATFMSRDGYHHHIGANTWAGAGAPPPPPTAARLLSYAIALNDEKRLTEIETRLDNAGYPVGREGKSLMTADPSGIKIRLSAFA